MTRILVTGASGLLGLNFALRFYRDHKVTGVDRRSQLTAAPFDMLSADLAEESAIERVLKDVQPKLVVHCAALANLDACEENPELAYQLNAEMPAEMAKHCHSLGIKLVHISTDAVFDGLRGNYREEDEPNPIGVYAASKLAGERAVLNANPSALVARVNFYGWSLDGNRSLAEFFFNNLTADRQVNGFTDVYFCPLEASLLVEILFELAVRNCAGLYHVVSSECWSKYDFGCALAERFGLDSSLIQPISIQQGGLRAARSPNLRLNNEKLICELGQPVPGQTASLERFFSLYQSGIVQHLRSPKRI